MATWLRRVGAIFGARAAEPAAVGPPLQAPSPRPPLQSQPPATAAAASDAESTAAAALDAEADVRSRFLAWLIGGPLDDALRAGEQPLLDHLGALIASRNSLAALLPRAPAVIPQLMNSLRDESQSTGALAQRVARDPHLVVEVIRMANSAQAQGGTPVTDIAEAIRRLGLSGLHRAILRVVLKPMFDGQGDSLTARCTQRLWQHSEAKAEACMQEAKARGLDPFEGYLAGLMHNVGWTAALRAIDRAEPRAATRFSQAFMVGVESQRDTLFGLLAAPWQLTDQLSALATELLAGGLAQAQSGLGQALRAADHRASLAVLGGAGVAAGVNAGAPASAR